MTFLSVINVVLLSPFATHDKNKVMHLLYYKGVALSSTLETPPPVIPKLSSGKRIKRSTF